MPTGYTAGIIDGTIKDFKQYAAACMRAFGATIHMRDEPLSKMYEPRTVSDYSSKQLMESHAKMQALKDMSDSELIDDEKNVLTEKIDRAKKRIEEIKETAKKLNAIRSDVEKWEPPTPEHVEFKKFMLSQIDDTIRFDGCHKYEDEQLEQYINSLQSLNASSIRAKRVEDIQWSIDYHSKENSAEILRCEKANNWVNSLIKSLE